MRKISDLLRETREKKNLTLDEVELETKIKKEFLHAIETGRFQRLPSESYAQGFVKNYAKFLGLPLSSAMPLFRREYKSKSSVHIVPSFHKTQDKFTKKLIFSPRNILIVAVAFLIGLYVFFEYSAFIFPPKLSITTPKEGQTLSENIVDVTGKTDPYATITVNNEDVYVNLQGAFRKSEYMFSGTNKITVVAKNRFGKQTVKTINIKIK